MMTVMMIVTVISVIIIWPPVSDSYIYYRCHVPVAIIERFITPVKGCPVIGIVPSGIICITIIIYRVGIRISYAKTTAAINTQTP
jgi:hypothetical protein